MSLSTNHLLVFTDLVNQRLQLYNHHRPESKKQYSFDTRSVRSSLLSVLIVYVLIILSPEDKKMLVIDIIKPTSAVIATALSLVVVYRQKSDVLIGKAF